MEDIEKLRIIQNEIYEVRGLCVVLDRDFAEICGVMKGRIKPRSAILRGRCYAFGRAAQPNRYQVNGLLCVRSAV